MQQEGSAQEVLQIRIVLARLSQRAKLLMGAFERAFGVLIRRGKRGGFAQLAREPPHIVYAELDLDFFVGSHQESAMRLLKIARR